MENVLVAGIVAFLVGGAAGYVWKAKKRGVKCVGCPYSGSCSGNCGCCGK